MLQIINSRRDLLQFTRDIIVDLINGHVVEYKYELTYNASEEIDVKKGILFGYLLPSEEPKFYFFCKLVSIDGGIWYGYCMYDHELETLYFTDWYNAMSISLTDFKDKLETNGNE